MPENNFRSLQKLAIVKSQTWSEAWRKASLRCHYHDGAIMVLLATKKSCKREVKALPFQGLEEKCSQETVPKGRVRLAVTGCHVWVDTHLFIRIHKISLVLPLLLPKYSKYSQNIPTTAKPTYVLSSGWLLTTIVYQRDNKEQIFQITMEMLRHIFHW